ncbi:MAG TPA: YhjD/YihY/BrkB family envelope integrity protein [Acidimicrobiales bacterium]|nr:YhjD/YihY/BrkB family envelope integrity protein [Acidimicrobiales bacterium]
MGDPEPARDADGGDRSPGAAAKWRQRYEGSAAQELVRDLGAIEFGDRIVLFGAALLLSVLPLIILLSALASRRVDDDIARHLGLGGQGSRVLEGLFRTSGVAFNLGVFVSLVLSLVGTIAVARSVQVIYEETFRQAHARGAWNLLRCFAWVAVLSGLLILDAVISGPLRNGPAGPLILGLVDVVVLTLFFWWSIHFLLAGRESWTRVGPSAALTAIFWMGLGVFASFYFSSTLVSDSRLYGEIGVVFTLATWFIAIGAVITLGAVTGAVWQRRRSRGAKSPR